MAKIPVKKAVVKNKAMCEIMKQYSDKRKGAAERDLVVGDEVLYDQLKGKRVHNKFLNQYESTQYRVQEVKGSMITVSDSNGRNIVRDISFFKKGSPIKDSASVHRAEAIDESAQSENVRECDKVAQSESGSVDLMEMSELRRSTREKKKTSFYGVNS